VQHNTSLTIQLNKEIKMNKLIATLIAGLFATSVYAQAPVAKATPATPASPAVATAPAQAATPATPATPAAKAEVKEVKEVKEQTKPAAAESKSSAVVEAKAATK
jgi:hypothetical protein